MKAKFINENIKDVLKGKSEEEVLASIKELSPSKILNIGIKNNDSHLIEYAFEKAANFAELKPMIHHLTSNSDYEYYRIYSDQFARYAIKNNIKLPIRYIFRSGLWKGELDLIKYALDKGIKISEESEYRTLKKHMPFDEFKFNLSDKLLYDLGYEVKKLSPEQSFSYALQHNDVNKMKKAIKKGAKNTNISNNEAFVIAVSKHDTELLKMLLKDSKNDPSQGGIQEQRYAGRYDGNYDNAPIKIAAREGYDDIVKLLLKDKRVDPSTANNYPFRYAYKNKHWKTVELLLNNNIVFRTLGIPKNTKSTWRTNKNG